MPARHGFLVSFSLKQFFPTFHLRILGIFNLEPSGSFSFRDIGSEGMLGNNALKIHLAHALKQGRAVLFYVIYITHSVRQAKPGAFSG